jgi:hypothetical protein
MHFGLAFCVHLERHRIGGLKLQELGASASNSLQFLTPADAPACLPKWTMTLNQNTYDAPLMAGSHDFKS